MRTTPKALKAAAPAALALVAGAALLAGTPGSANAGVKDYHDCPNGNVCLWGDASYTGRWVFYPESKLPAPNIDASMNDLTTSIWNRTSKKVCFYGDANYQKELLCLDPGGSSANIGAGDNDNISSLQAF